MVCFDIMYQFIYPSTRINRTTAVAAPFPVVRSGNWGTVVQNMKYHKEQVAANQARMLDKVEW